RLRYHVRYHSTDGPAEHPILVHARRTCPVMARWWSAKRFDLIELTLIAAGAAFVAYATVSYLRPQYVYPAAPAKASNCSSSTGRREILSTKKSGSSATSSTTSGTAFLSTSAPTTTSF